MTDTAKDLETKALICELCRQFFQEGWVTGTGGSISIRNGDKIFMTPSGVQKERIQPDEIFTVNIQGEIVETPVQKDGCRAPKLSDCAPLFLHAYQQRGAGAVLHSHSIGCNIITTLFEGSSEFTISHQEMIKGIDGHGYFDTLVIPIIENTAWEHELADSLGETIAKYPKSCAVLVRRHGMYVWGNSWEQAKRHAECLHYLFDVAIRMKQFGIDFNSPPKPVLAGGMKRPADVSLDTQAKKSSKVYRHVILDIEGTTTPISFVKDVLFPYSERNMAVFLKEKWSTDTVSKLVSSLHEQAIVDFKSAQFTNDNSVISNFCENSLSSSESSVSAATRYATWCIGLDRKITPLKKLQGLIWEDGYRAGDLKGSVFCDVVPQLKCWKEQGSAVSIYSSGSKYAQQLLFRNSEHGDLTGYLHCYFDTSVGQKQGADSYKEILLTLGAAHRPGDVLFVTDVLAEAQAAQSAGLDVVVSVRPGNATLEMGHSFRCVTSFDQI